MDMGCAFSGAALEVCLQFSVDQFLVLYVIIFQE